MQVNKQQLEPYREQLIGSRLRKEYDSCLLSPCLSNLYAEHIMRNAGLDELQTGIKIGQRYTNNLSYVDDSTLMAESEEEQRSFLIRVKEESERADLILNIKKVQIMATGSITSWQKRGDMWK